MKPRSRIALAVCLPLLLLILVVAWLLYTPSGTRQVFKLVSQQGLISYQGLEGAIGTGLRIDSLTLQADGVETNIRSFELVLRLSDMLKARLTLEKVHAESVILELKSAPKPADKRIESPLEQLKLKQGMIPFELVVEEMTLHQLTLISAENEWQLDSIELSSKADQQGISDTQLNLNYGSTQVQLSGTAYLFPALHLDLNADWSTTGFKGQPIHGRAAIKADTSKLKLTQRTTGEMVSQLNLQVGDWLEAPIFKLSGNIQQLAWPGTTPQGEYVLSSITLNAQGPAEKLQSNLSGKLTIGAQSPMSLNMQAIVSPEHLQVESLSISSNQHGLAQLSGLVDWSKGLTQWRSQLILEDFNAHLFDERLPTSLTGTLNMSGQWTDQLELQLHSPKLKGTLHGNVFDSHFKVQLINREVWIEDLTVSSGEDSFNLKGTLNNNRLATALIIKVNEIEYYYPAVKGSIHVNAQLSGTPQAPTLKANLLGKRISLAELTVGTLQADLQLIDGIFQADKNTLTATELDYQGLNANNIQILAKGDWRQPQLTLQAKASALDLLLETNAEFNEQAVTGKLSNLIIESERHGRWQLEEKVSYQLETQKKQFSQLCLKELKGKLCLKASLINNQIAANLDGTNIPAELMGYISPSHLPIQGTFNTRGMTAGTLDNPEISLQLFQGSSGTPLVIGSAEETQKRLTLNKFSAEIELKNHTLTSSAQADINTSGYLESMLTVEALDKKTNPLNGHISFYLPGLQPYAQLLPEINHLDGEFKGRIKLGNNLQHPSMQLDSELTIDSIYINTLAVELNEFHLKTSTLSSNRHHLEGKAKAGDGVVNLAGTMRLSSVEDWQIDLQLTGENALLMNQPHQRLVVTPNLALRVTPTLIDLQGNLLIPSANIAYQSSAQRLSLTPDAVIHGQQSQSEKEIVAYKMDLQLQAGEDVHLEAFGINTGLKGQLNLNKPLDGTLTGQGLVELIDGAYRAYGQDLTVDRGFIRFSGTLSDPDLDLEASRRIKDVRAGLRVVGPVSNLKTTLFSEPALPETEILSYILRGKSLQESNSQEKNTLANAMLAYSISQSSPITNQVSELSGLDEIGIEAEEGIDTVGLTLGKYITPRLYVRYGIGLVDQLNKLFLQYQLTNRLYLETESGAGQSIDLIYRSK